MGESMQQAWDEKFPEDAPGCAHDGEMKKNGKEFICTDCGEAWTETPIQRSEIEAPAPPEIPATEYMRPPPPAPSTYNKHKDKPMMRVCFSARLADSADESLVVTELNRYLVEQTGFAATVVGGERLGRRDGRWFDLVVNYSMHITEVYAKVLEHEWVLDAEAKPAADVGVVMS